MKLIVIIIAMLFPLVSVADEYPEWRVEFGWTSGWGSGPVLSIASDGKMSSTTSHPYGRKICGIRLDVKELGDIKKRIDEIPDDILYGTRVEYLDHCADERENFIYLTSGDKRRGFSYSQPETCWERKVPQWLLKLNEELNRHAHAIENCPEVPVKK